MLLSSFIGEHCIRDEQDYKNYVNYIHYNPVKHGYVKHPTDWRYSTVHDHILKGKVNQDWGYSEKDKDEIFGERE